jgi:hypothetical protein
MGKNDTHRSATVSVEQQKTTDGIYTDHQSRFLELAAMRMPFGRYSGRRLVDLPEPYIVWFGRNGFPEGKLGEMLRIVYEIKVNGLEYLFTPLR